MKIGQFNTYPHGGAFIAADRFHQQLLASGIESNFYYRYADRPAPIGESYRQVDFGPLPAWRQLNPLAHEIQKRRRRRIHKSFDRHLSSRSPNEPGFAMAELPDATPWNWRQRPMDIMHLHWIAHFVDFPSFFHSIPRDLPIVWTLHDMFPLTGGCHYSNGCRSYQTYCGSCSLIRNPSADDVSHQSVLAKRRALAGRDLMVIAPSQWLLDLARQSPIWPKETRFLLMRYGLDLQIFAPQPKPLAKSALGFDPVKVLVGFGADNLSDRRKGGVELLAALNRVPPSIPFEVAVFGNGLIGDELLPNRRIHRMGYLADPTVQAQLFSACDVIAIPSREDNQPSVGLESLACGTPVVAFRAGGITEYVRHGINGLTAQVDDIIGLASALEALLCNPQARQQMSERGRMMIIREFEIANQTKALVQTYQSLISKGESIRRSKAA